MADDKKRITNSEFIMSTEARKRAIDEIIELRYEKLYTKVNVVNHLREKYGIQKTTSYTLIKDADLQYAEIPSEETREIIFERVIANFESIRKMAFEDGKWDIATRATTEIAKLHGLYNEHMAQFGLRGMTHPITIEVLRSNDIDYKSLGVDLDDFPDFDSGE